MATQAPLILVVDDDPGVLKLVETLLTRAGMQPILAENALKAAQALKSKPLPQVMVLDLMLPDVSGIDFLKQMRAKPNFDDLPVLILSALADPAQIREGLSAGADRYLTKPYLANNLISTLQEMLRTGRVRR
jgi:two-component system phosphate regulon response regulator PhoB